MIVAWDEHKNRANKIKHGVSFELAQEVFEDRLALSKLDRVTGGEQRWHTLGMANGILLIVSHTVYEREDEEIIRIISARKATAQERKQYE